MRWIARAAVVVVVAVALAAGIAAAVAGRPMAAEPIYTPAQFAALHLRSRLRVGDTLYIRGALRDFGAFPGWGGSGAIAQTSSRYGVSVFVVYGPRSDILRLRGLPLIGPLIPPTADHPTTGKVAVFRVRAVRCAVSPACYFRTPALQLQDGGAS